MGHRRKRQANRGQANPRQVLLHADFRTVPQPDMKRQRSCGEFLGEVSTPFITFINSLPSSILGDNFPFCLRFGFHKPSLSASSSIGLSLLVVLLATFGPWSFSSTSLLWFFWFPGFSILFCFIYRLLSVVNSSLNPFIPQFSSHAGRRGGLLLRLFYLVNSSCRLSADLLACIHHISVPLFFSRPHTLISNKNLDNTSCRGLIWRM